MHKPFLTGYKRHNPLGFKILNFSIFLCLHYIISIGTQTTYFNKKLRTLRVLYKAGERSRVCSFFFIHPVVLSSLAVLTPVVAPTEVNKEQNIDKDREKKNGLFIKSFSKYGYGL